MKKYFLTGLKRIGHCKEFKGENTNKNESEVEEETVEE